MRIAQVTPLYEAVPPRLYGGTERVVAHLTDALVELGHEVTLFASAEAETKARLVPVRDQAIRLDPAPLKSDLAAHLSMLSEVRRRQDQFDVIHFHTDMIHFPFFEGRADRTVTTLHGRLDLKDLPGVYKRWPRFPLVSISDDQRRPLPFANWAATVQHGMAARLYDFSPKPGGYLAFLGRISPEKRPDRAIAIAKATGRRLKIAAKVDAADRVYFEEQIEPLLHHPLIEFIGEIGDAQKSAFLGGADALLFPIDWPEPFGLVMIEAMACGTPVIAYDCGSVREVIEDGLTGFIVQSNVEAIGAVSRLPSLNRGAIRQRFEERFSATAMAQRYVDLYDRLGARETSLGLAAAERGRRMDDLAPGPDAPAILEDTGATRSPNRTYALKDRNTFLVADPFGDVLGLGDGLFHDDTRILSRFRLLLGSHEPSLLSAAIGTDNVFFTSHSANQRLPFPGGPVAPPGVLHIARKRFLWDDRLFERIRMVNYSRDAVIIPLTFEFDADFHDMFEVRGMVRARRGRRHPAQSDGRSVSLRYTGLDDVDRESFISFSDPPFRLSDHKAEFMYPLGPESHLELYIEIGMCAGPAPTRERFRGHAARARASMRLRGRQGARVRSSGRIFSEWIDKSKADLALLTTELETGPYPYAGIPWFSTTFGRDAIITAYQVLWLDPSLAKGVLQRLAATQATEVSAFRDSAPGKIMHEARSGEMAALGEVPFGRYYGGVDTTPLFVALAGAYVERTGDMDLIDRLWPHLEAAVGWIERYGDTDGDGLIDYARGAASGLANQGWKDSQDSVFHANGRFATGPIALVEVQGYAFAAYRAMSTLAKLRGEAGRAEVWHERAELIRRTVEEAFWMEDKGFYAIAVDGQGELCEVLSSNPGHLLFARLIAPERARKVTDRLLRRDFAPGWGVRTLALGEARFNPMSYHNGSVWPHDTALCALGMSHYGEREGVVALTAALFETAANFEMRLPELFCGFPRQPGEPPVAYPVACLPQAWAAGSVFMMLQACLGVSIDALAGSVTIVDPHLPIGIDRLWIDRLQVGDEVIGLAFERRGDRVAVTTEGPAGLVTIRGLER